MVEGAALEKQCAGNGTVGSNPTLSARSEAVTRVAVLLLEWVCLRIHLGSVEQSAQSASWRIENYRVEKA